MNKLFLSSLLLLLLSGCSSIISKSEYSVAIDSSPSSSQFVITNEAGQRVHSGVTPASVTLKSSAGFFNGETYIVTFTKDGFAEKQFTINSSVDGWYFGNILFGGIIGMLIVDPATGAMYNLPDRVDVSLDKPLASTDKTKITIATIDSLTDYDRLRLQPIE